MNAFLSTVLIAIRNEGLKGFGRTNFFLVLIGAAVIGFFADNIPEMCYNIAMSIVDGFSKQHHQLANLSKPPFWMAVSSFLVGQVLCIGGTFQYAKFEHTNKKKNNL